jgi:hypothetical protein
MLRVMHPRAAERRPYRLTAKGSRAHGMCPYSSGIFSHIGACGLPKAAPCSAIGFVFFDILESALHIISATKYFVMLVISNVIDTIIFVSYYKYLLQKLTRSNNDDIILLLAFSNT